MPSKNANENIHLISLCSRHYCQVRVSQIDDSKKMFFKESEKISPMKYAVVSKACDNQFVVLLIFVCAKVGKA